MSRLSLLARAGLVALLLGAGCAASSGEDKAGGEAPAQPDPALRELYDTARGALEAGDLDRAEARYNKLLDKAETADEAASLARRGELDLAHLHYSRGDYADAEKAAAGFRETHGDAMSREQALYARFLQARAVHEQARARSQRDPLDPQVPERLREAFRLFRSVAENHPQSGLLAPVRERMAAIHDALARYEYNLMAVFARSGEYEEVLARARYVQTHYGAVGVRGHVMAAEARALAQLGRNEEAAAVRNELAQRYPDIDPSRPFAAAAES